MDDMDALALKYKATQTHLANVAQDWSGTVPELAGILYVLCGAMMNADHMRRFARLCGVFNEQMRKEIIDQIAKLEEGA